jgi:hypothetical protein
VKWSRLAKRKKPSLAALEVAAAPGLAETGARVGQTGHRGRRLGFIAEVRSKPFLKVTEAVVTRTRRKAVRKLTAAHDSHGQAMTNMKREARYSMDYSFISHYIAQMRFGLDISIPHTTLN